ncbi:hypothetical protein CPB86DRAFT_811069 [Serendipita vermifera]|nr:hypothetical protein CPB86DRAFT_811069 [Serendipita vermifera]
MTSIFQIDQYNDMWRVLPGGIQILFQHHYSQAEVRGIWAVVIASIISSLAIVALLSVIAISLVRDWITKSTKTDKRNAFIKSHAGIYFVCMLLTTLLYSFGFLLSIIWAIEMKITFGSFCSIQAALKQFGNVATALWVLSIAVHTFVVVFLQISVKTWVGYVVFVGVWLLSGFICAAGPSFYVNDQMGPWYGISAQWCWTSDSYVIPRFITEYFWMFLAAGVSFLLYILLFLKLRGHISSEAKFSFKARPLNYDTSRVAHQMLWYPIVYAVLVFPIVGCRIYEFRTAKKSNLEIKMGSAVVFTLSGLVNVILYTVTRNIIPLPRFLRQALGLRTTSDSSENSEDDDAEKGGWTRLSRQVSSSSPAKPEFAVLARVPSSDKPTTTTMSRSPSPKQIQPSLLPDRKSSLPPQAFTNSSRLNLSRQGTRSSSNGPDTNPFADTSRVASPSSSSSLSPSSSSPLGNNNIGIIVTPPQSYQPPEDKGKKNRDGNGLVRTNSNASNSGEIVTINPNANATTSGSGLKKWNSTSSTSSTSSGRPGSIDSVSSGGSGGSRKAGRIVTTVAKSGRKVIKKPQPMAGMELIPVV